MVIGFLRTGVHPDNVLAYKHILGDKGIRVFAVAGSKEEKAEYNRVIRVYCMEDYLKSHWHTTDTAYLAACQKEYEEYSLWEIFHTDRYMRYKYNGEDADKMNICLIGFWKYVLRDSHATHLVSDAIIGAGNFMGMLVGKHMGIPYISGQPARYKNYYSYFSLDEGYRAVEYEWLQKSCYMPTDSEIKAAGIFVNNYISKKKQPAYIKNAVMGNKNPVRTALCYAGKIPHAYYLWNGRYKNKYNPCLYKKNLWEDFSEAFSRLVISRFFKKPDYQDDYILFPLHFQPEASTCVYARKYENQMLFLEQLAKSIPAGKKLYVKEHAVRQGHRPLEFYRELGKYPQIRLIGPDTDAHELIRHSSFLIVLTSTMGYEALMYGKPVFVCGSCFFERFSGARRIYDVFDEKKEFLNPPVQDRQLYLRQMAVFLKTVHFYTTMGEPLFTETPGRLYEIQKRSMEELLRFIDKMDRMAEESDENRIR